jgi:hypothetical protein
MPALAKKTVLRPIIVETRMTNRPRSAARDVILMLVAVLMLAACGGPGVTGPCDDSDPVGPCATSHSQTHGGS